MKRNLRGFAAAGTLFLAMFTAEPSISSRKAVWQFWATMSLAQFKNWAPLRKSPGNIGAS